MNITAERLRSLREKKGLSQSQVADIIGVTRTAYIHYETGRYKPVRKLKELCKLFNISSDYILGTDIEKTSIDDKKPKDLAKFLDDTEIMFDGEIYKLSDADRQKLRNALEFVFWDAKKENKRKNKSWIVTD